MINRLTVDSSVIISSLLKTEQRHKEAISILEDILNGRVIAIMPISILVEVVSAIRRRTGSYELAMEIKNELLNIDNICFVIVDEKSAIKSAEIAAQTGLRGMDALVVQVAREFNTELITFDDEMLVKSKLLASLK